MRFIACIRLFIGSKFARTYEHEKVEHKRKMQNIFLNEQDVLFPKVLGHKFQE